MLDVSYFQNNNNNVQIFQNGGQWFTWIKPRGAKIVNMIVVGSGGGGGGGFQASGTRSGGAGGGTGACVRATFPANLLPDILYIYCGLGGSAGVGGTVPTPGGNGQNSIVSIIPDTGSTINLVIRSGTTPAVGGQSGTTLNSAGGAGETAGASTINLFWNLGLVSSNVGVVGGNGGTSGAVNQSMTNFLVSGSGGGGSGASSTGGGLTSPGPYPLIAATPINTNGLDGFVLYKPFGLIGGRGGGGQVTGGRGGNGAPGTGGGGGGAGSTSAGNGGRGGDGFVIITTNF